jgi:hypothetical protein
MHFPVERMAPVALTPTDAAEPIRSSRGWYVAIALTALAIFGLSVLAMGQARRGRWDLNQHIATADRVAAGGNYYTSGADNLYASSTPYFPGVTFIAQAVNMVARDRVDTLMLVAASLLLLAYLWTLGLVGRRLGVDVLSAVLASAFIARVFLFEWIGYAVEFKPDTLALLAGTGVLLLASGSSTGIARLLSILALTLIGAASKQQFLFFFAGLMLMVIWSPYPAARRDKWAIGATMIAAGVATLTLLSIDNLYQFAIAANQQRPRLPFRTFVQQIQFVFECWPVVIAALAYLLVHAPDALRRRQFLPPERGFAFWYGGVAFLWFIMSARSAINVGGNIGNVAVGVAPLIPLAIVLMLKVTRPQYHHGLFVGLAVMLAMISARDGWKFVVEYQEHAAREQHIVAYLNQTFAGKSVLNDGDGYMVVRKAGLLHMTEFDTVAHLALAGRDAPELRAAIDAEAFDVVLTYASTLDYWVERYPGILAGLKKHYVAVDDPANPLPGRLFIRAGQGHVAAKGATF